MTLGDLEYRVLQVLIARPQDAYGVTIMNHLNNKVSLGALYTTLDRLEKRGFVISEWGESTPERGGRRKRYFYIQQSGRDAVKKAEA